MYDRFELPKKNGKARIIMAPDNRLKHLQRKIAKLIDQIYRVRRPVHGFALGKSVKSNALSHLSSRYLLNLDIKDFFPSITERRVVGLLDALGIESRVATIIGRLCCCRGHLPQGAPTSPILSNMICFRLDKDLLVLAKGMRCIYTRYADDITFSSHHAMIAFFEGSVPPAGRLSADHLAPALKGVFASNGFTINPDKVHYADRNSRRMVTGIKVNQILNLDRRYVRNVRATLYAIETLGYEAAEQKFRSKFGDKSSLQAYLQGKLSWLRFIRGQSDPVFRRLAIRFNRSFPKLAIKVTPTDAEIRDRAVWLVEHGTTQGTAFFVKDIGLITAAHCVEDIMKVELYHPSKPANKFEATVLKRDEHRDLAVLAHELPPTEYLELECSTHAVSNGDKLIALGYPGYAPGDKLNIREGTVSSLPVKRAVQMIEVTQKLAQGMSGGPLLDSNNAVVGVVHKGGPNEGRDFAIHIKELTDWLSK